MKEERSAEIVEDFKLRIAAIIRAKPEQIPLCRDRARSSERLTGKQNLE